MQSLSVKAAGHASPAEQTEACVTAAAGWLCPGRTMRSLPAICPPAAPSCTFSKLESLFVVLSMAGCRTYASSP